jgi:hypothetical protein
MPGGSYLPKARPKDPRDPRAWRTLLTDIPAINGTFPPNVLQEEILHDHPEHLRAVLSYAANPLRSYADTTAYEKAFKKLDLLVVADIAMSETAALAHYVLPCKTAFESWEGTLGTGISNIYARMRSPVVAVQGEQKENAEIFTLLADAMGLIPEIPKALFETAERWKSHGVCRRQNPGAGIGLCTSGQHLPFVYAIIQRPTGRSGKSRFSCGTGSGHIHISSHHGSSRRRAHRHPGSGEEFGKHTNTQQEDSTV